MFLRLLTFLTLLGLIALCHSAPVSRASLQKINIAIAKPKFNAMAAPVSRWSVQDQIAWNRKLLEHTVLANIEAARNGAKKHAGSKIGRTASVSRMSMEDMVAEQRRFQKIILKYNHDSNIQNALHSNKKGLKDKMGSS